MGKNEEVYDSCLDFYTWHNRFSATGYGRAGWGYSGPGYGTTRQVPCSETQQNWKVFNNDIAPIRKQLFAKRVEYNEAMSQKVIDKELAAKHLGEIIDLKIMIRE